MNEPPRPLPETPRSALGPTVRETVLVDGRPFVLSRPDAVDRLIDDPVLGAASASEEYMPYWASLWAGAHVLAEAVLNEPWPASGSNDRAHALEIGCGLGLPGLAALARGFRVTFSDYDAAALRYAAESARGNGFTDFQVLQMDWRWPPEAPRFPLLLAADVAYDLDLFAPLAALVRRLLAPDGLCLIANGDRVQVPALLQALGAESLSVAPQPHRGKESVKLYRIRHIG